MLLDKQDWETTKKEKESYLDSEEKEIVCNEILPVSKYTKNSSSTNNPSSKKTTPFIVLPLSWVPRKLIVPCRLINKF